MKELYSSQLLASIYYSEGSLDINIIFPVSLKKQKHAKTPSKFLITGSSKRIQSSEL